MSMEMNKAMELLRGLVSEIERQTCEHEETHRGGAIWEICDSCGAKWADDEGGKPEFEWPESVEKAREFLAAHPAVEQAGGDERAAFEAWWQSAEVLKCKRDVAMEAWQARAALAQPSPALPPFAEKVLAKLRRFYECAEDPGSGGVDIGRHWLDLLTQLGLLNRVQRSPALWEISQQGEDLLGTPHPSPAQAEKAEAERPIVSFEKYMQVMYDRDENAKRLDAALARIAELERPDTDYTQHPQIVGYARKKDLGPLLDPCMPDGGHIYIGLDHPSLWSEEPPYEFLTPLYTAPVAQAQPSVPIAHEFKRALGLVVAALEADGDRPTSKYALSELKKVLAAAPGKEGL